MKENKNTQDGKKKGERERNIKQGPRQARPPQIMKQINSKKKKLELKHGREKNGLLAVVVVESAITSTQSKLVDEKVGQSMGHRGWAQRM